MVNKAFRARYNALNKEQREAVDTIEGPVMVVAGPGTGKTTVLSLRIANILAKTHARPENILALTFTESGVYQMRKSLVGIIGSVAYRVEIATFHGFCNGLIKNYPEYFADIIGSTGIGLVEQIRLFEKVVEDTDVLLLRPSGNHFYYVLPALKKIGELKKDAVTPEDFSALTRKEERRVTALERRLEKGAKLSKARILKRRRDVEKSKELALLYARYEDTLRSEHLYDYDDMIMEVVHALEAHKDFQLELEEQFQYILADEHQDANRAQNRVLELLSSFHDPYPNLFIVGDEKQAIFRFQGASLDNFLYVKKRYPAARLMNLRTSYRAHQGILDAAHSLIVHSPGAGVIRRRRLQSGTRKTARAIRMHAFGEEDYEIQFVVEEVRRLQEAGVPRREIAVLYRDNKDAIPFMDVFEKAGIVYSVLSDEDVLDDEDIRKLILLFRVVVRFGDDRLVSELLHADFLGFSSLDIYKVIAHARRRGVSIYEVMVNPRELTALSLENSEKFVALFERLARWSKTVHNTPLARCAELLISESGFLEHVLSSGEAGKKLERLESLYREIKAIAGVYAEYYLPDFLAHLDLMKRYRLRIQRKEMIFEDAVRLLTAHRAKGMEFSHVFIVGAYDGHWGRRTRRDFFPLTYVPRKDADDVDDERRLFYVALTRAGGDVYITYAKRNNEGKERLPAQFIEEIDPRFLTEVNVAPIEAVFEEKKTLFSAGARAAETPQRSMRGYLRERFREQGLSITALNNYLRCPWHYFFMNLVRMPHAPTESQLFGTAVHDALRLFFEKRKEEAYAGKQDLLSLFASGLSKRPFAETRRGEFLARGERALAGYYDTYRDAWPRNVLTEFTVRGVLLDGGVRLSGKIDKIEFLGAGSQVNVIDYKTGKPKSRADIEGKTASSHGDYKRQLVFYKLLLDHFDKRRYTMVSGELDFVEPNAHGRWKKEKFIVGDEEARSLERLIGDVAREILEFKFWNKTCGRRNCEYCTLSTSLKF